MICDDIVSISVCKSSASTSPSLADTRTDTRPVRPRPPPEDGQVAEKGGRRSDERRGDRRVGDDLG